jgi:Spy/CpxP family protein refolding chaperone
MWKHAKLYLGLVSVTLNAAFVATWIVHAVPLQGRTEHAEPKVPQPAIWCPLHRELQVTPEQWQQIEPRLREFQSEVGVLCQQTDTMRSEVIDLLAAPEPDLPAIRAKQDEILATKQNIQQRVVDHLLSEKQILTSAQQQRLFALLRERTACAADPPLSGSRRGGLGRTLQNHERKQ